MKIARKIIGMSAAFMLTVTGISGIDAVTGDIPAAQAACSATVYHNSNWTGYAYSGSCKAAQYYARASYRGKVTTYYAPKVSGKYRYSRFNTCYAGSIVSGGGTIWR